MARAKTTVVLTCASGKVFGSKQNTSLRIVNGQEYTYTYNRKPKEWSETQQQMRKAFGAASYYARLLLKDEAIAAYYAESFRKQKQYHRLDRYAEHLVWTVVKTDEELKATALAAREEHIRLILKPAEHESAIARQLTAAKALWESKLKDKTEK